MDPVIRLLSDLVSIPSVNPMGRGLDGPWYLEGRMSDYLVDYFRRLGVPYDRVEIAPGRDNVIARYESSPSAPTVLFDAHQDTVPVDGMIIDPFKPDIVGGKLYGRGSCDIKGGMASMLTAFARLVKEKPAGAANVVMACTVDEEYTHIGSSYLAEHPQGADVVIASEPTMLDIVNTHKGAVRWKVKAGGIACHSSTPHLGDNAIYRMGRILEGLRIYATELSESAPDPVLGPPSLSVGRIEGGQSVNIVPDWCDAEIDRRLIPGETPESAMEKVRAFLTTHLAATDPFEFSAPWVKMPALKGRAPSEDPWIPPMVEAIARIRGTKPAIKGVPFGTDAGPLGDTGLPAFVFGPGDIAQAHTRDEWVELDQIRLAAEIYHAMALELGKARP